MLPEHNKELKIALVASVLVILGAVIYEATNNIVGLIIIGLSLLLLLILELVWL